MTRRLFPKRLMTLAYSASLVLMMGYALWLYGMGNYQSLSIPAFLTLLLLAALLLHLGQTTKGYIAQVLLLVGTCLAVLNAIFNYPYASIMWLGLPMASVFLLLPLWTALALASLIGPLVWLAISHPPQPISFLFGYITLLLLLALPRWEHARHKALLHVTDPNDSDCDAYNIDTLKERLHNEYQRAAMLNRRLAVLVIHLPQLDMAEEQFGARAKIALLNTLCSEVNARCRDHDVLGRAGDATFWLVLPDTSESGALLVRERLHYSLSQCVLIETGQLEARIAACLPRKESFERYVHRLNARANALANG
ncbi:diguanylate cyclase domain-containing protein [Vreelandella populi]|uniref:Diguanylate cyclase n=1 Tax=Vreelandella populi TaxID=2498858 RepID=A0A433LH14_9GAMM|nr:diguanylate cyclase [Halomonas populi]RUR40790.1 diguanylate cyclase [Halomonas populi]RUR49297.1 diguanylate cyclase [Halomonas populi]